MLPILLSACLLSPGGDVVARMGQRSFRAEELGLWMAARSGHVELWPFVMEQMVLAEADELGLSPSVAEVEAALAEEQQGLIDRFYSGDREAWIRKEAAMGNHPDDAGPRRMLSLKPELALTRLALRMRVVTEDDLAATFERDYGDLKEQISIEALFFSFYTGLVPGEQRPELTLLDSRTRARAEPARQRLANGAPLDELLELADPVESDFLERGVVSTWRRNLLGVEMERAVNSLDDPGDTAPLVKVWDGYWVVRLLRRREVSLDGLRGELRQQLLTAPVTGEEQAAVREHLTQKYAPEYLLK